MRHLLCWSVILLATSVTVASAQVPPAKQAPAKEASAAGTWNGKTMVGPKDSVVATYTITIAADGKSATTQFPNREPIPTRIIAMGGDSVVTEAGPYPSVLRAGETVNLLRTVGHYKGDNMTGTFEAQYAKGDVLKGKTAATRAK